MRVMAPFFNSFFLQKCLRVVEDGPVRGHLCHIDTFLVYLWIERPIYVPFHFNRLYVLTHLHRLDSSTTTLWTDLFPIAGCLISFYHYYIL